MCRAGNSTVCSTHMLLAVSRASCRSLLIREEDVGQVFLPAALSDAKPEAL